MAYAPLHILAMEHGQAPHAQMRREIASSGVAPFAPSGAGDDWMISTARSMRLRQRFADFGVSFLAAKFAAVAHATADKLYPLDCTTQPPYSRPNDDLRGKIAATSRLIRTHRNFCVNPSHLPLRQPRDARENSPSTSQLGR